MKTTSKIIIGNTLDVMPQMPEKSIHTAITSPPFFRLRSYLPDDHPMKKHEIGLEKTLPEFIEKLVKVFAEVHRVLRDDGTLWIEIGDSYANDGKWGGKSGNKNYTSDLGGVSREKKETGFPAKSLMDIPWRLAFALQDWGWVLRDDIIWHKTNAMPSSQTDRTTKAHSYVFTLTKKPHYYYDLIAIQEPAAYDGRKAEEFKGSKKYKGEAVVPGTGNNDYLSDNHPRWQKNEDGERVRNKRSVWSIATANLSEAHFASFPEKLVEPMILAGTSAHGVCADCGAPYKRIYTKETDWQERKANGAGAGNVGVSDTYQNNVHGSNNTHHYLGGGEIKTLGWQKTCECETVEIVPATVLDPFAGSGTTGIVALKHKRNFIGIDLSDEYEIISSKRTKDLQVNLF